MIASDYINVLLHFAPLAQSEQASWLNLEGRLNRF